MNQSVHLEVLITINQQIFISGYYTHQPVDLGAKIKKNLPLGDGHVTVSTKVGGFFLGLPHN
jgi:hypothetical protein